MVEARSRYKAHKAREAAAKILATTVIIRPPSPRPPGLKVAFGKAGQGERTLSPTELGSEIEVDPEEEYAVEVIAANREPWRTTVRVSPTDRKLLVIPQLTAFTLAIAVKDPDLAGLEVRRDGRVVDPSSYGSVEVVSAGEHEVSASADRCVPWSITVLIDPSRPAARVEVPVLSPIAPPPPVKRYSLTITVAEPDTPGLVIRRDGDIVDRDHWDSPQRVNAGRIIVNAYAPDKLDWTDGVEVSDDAPDIVVHVPALADPPHPGRAARAVGGVLVGIGVPALAGAVGTAIAATVKHNAANGHCTSSGVCDHTGYDAETLAGTLANTTTGLLVSGSVVTFAGILAIRMAPHDIAPPPPPAAAVPAGAIRPFVGVWPGGVTVGGIF